MRFNDANVAVATAVEGVLTQEPGNGKPTEQVPVAVLNSHIETVAGAIAGGTQNVMTYTVADSTDEPLAGHLHFNLGTTIGVKVHTMSTTSVVHKLFDNLKKDAVFVINSKNVSNCYIRGTLAADPVLTGSVYSFALLPWVYSGYPTVTPETELACLQFVNAASGTVTSADTGPFTVVNKTAGVLVAGKPYYISSFDTASKAYTIAKAQANSKATSTNVVVLTTDLAVDQVGVGVSLGNVANIDMSAYESGVELYVSASTAGEWSTTDPSYPNISCKGGVVGDATITGSMAVNLDPDPTYKEGTVSTAEQLETMSIALTNASVQVQSGQANAWAMTATMLLPKDIVNINASSKLTCFISQGTGSFMMAIYKKEDNNSLTRIAYTPIITATTKGFYTSAIAVDAFFDASDTLYFALLTGANDIYIRGASSFISNTTPYVNGHKTNLGTLTVPPTSLTFEGEFASAVYIELKR